MAYEWTVVEGLDQEGFTNSFRCPHAVPYEVAPANFADETNTSAD